MTDLISRAEAMSKCKNAENELTDEAERKGVRVARFIIGELPSADADGEDLIIKGAKGIQDGLYNIKDGKLFKYKAKGGTVRTYPIVPSADAVPQMEHDREWIIGCIKHDGFIKTDRFDKANQIILEALSADRPNGEWEFVDNEIFAGEYFCSVCGKRAEVDLYGEWILSNFCPSCGAIMKGGVK